MQKMMDCAYDIGAILCAMVFVAGIVGFLGLFMYLIFSGIGDMRHW